MYYVSKTSENYDLSSSASPDLSQNHISTSPSSTSIKNLSERLLYTLYKVFH